MLSAFLLPEIEITGAGFGPPLDLGEDAGFPLLLTLGITRVREQQSLDVTIQGSESGVEWLSHPLLTLSQKYYAGDYQVLLDLRSRPAMRFIRAKWAANRWGRGELNPSFGIFLFVQGPVEGAIAAVTHPLEPVVR